MSDAVEHPAHYDGQDDPFEAIKVIDAWGLNFCLGNTVKYIARAGKKPGASEREDLKKGALVSLSRDQAARGEQGLSYSARVILDSLAPCGARLTTMELTYPRIILAEVNTHRMLSKNTESSRARPVMSRIAAVISDPFVPEAWGKNQRGMVAESFLDQTASEKATDIWLRARSQMTIAAAQLADLDVHKQYAGRLLEPFSWTTQIISATEWANFFALRCSPDAQPEFRTVAEMALDAYLVSQPRRLDAGAWHLPYIQPDEQYWPLDARCEVSTARCARVSTLTHDGTRDADKDRVLFQKLLGPGHWSPFEHPARALARADQLGNYTGWAQLRKTYPGENRTTLPRLVVRS